MRSLISLIWIGMLFVAMVSLVHAATKPDLKIENIWNIPASPEDGEEVVFHVYVKNVGQVTSQSCEILCLVDNNYFANGTVPPLYPYRKVHIYTGPRPWNATPGKHTVTWVVDPYGTIDESKEDNNNASINFEVAGIPPTTTPPPTSTPTPPPPVPPPDFAISIAPSSLTVSNGSHVTYTITVSSVNNFSSTVILTFSISPSGPTGILSPISVTPTVGGSAVSTLIVNVPSTMNAGTHTINITGVSGTLSHSSSATLVVTIALPPIPTPTPTPTPTTTTPSPRTSPFPKCVISTIAQGGPLAKGVAYLRYVRDNMIGSNRLGSILINRWNSFYYYWSPPLAQFLDKHDAICPASQILLLPIFGIAYLTTCVYTLSSPISTTLASVIAFLFAAISSVTFYIVAPLFVLRSIIRTALSRGVFQI